MCLKNYSFIFMPKKYYSQGKRVFLQKIFFLFSKPWLIVETLRPIARKHCTIGSIIQVKLKSKPCHLPSVSALPNLSLRPLYTVHRDSKRIPTSSTNQCHLKKTRRRPSFPCSLSAIPAFNLLATKEEALAPKHTTTYASKVQRH